MSQSSGSDSSLETSLIKNTVGRPLSGTFFSNTLTGALDNADDEESLTETNSSTTTENSHYQYLRRINSVDSVEEIPPQTLKEWIKLAKILISRSENSENKQTIAKKSDELQDFFYFLAIEYFSTQDFLVEFLEDKRNEFINNWENTIEGCAQIFDLLIEVIDDIDLDSSFSIV